MKNFIIGIAGRKNSGKDTIASMINYIFTVGITKASYSDWVIKKTSIDNTNSDRIVHFADGLKNILSIIYNIPREFFDDRVYKDNKYFNITSGSFTDIKNVNGRIAGHNIIDIDFLNKHPLSSAISSDGITQVYIKLRTLMQYFGTNICRKQLADDIWIRQTMNKVINIAESRRLCLIPDVRFENEASAIRCNTPYLYGGVIKINRDNYEKEEHCSESLFVNSDFNIDNNGTMLQLFFKVLNICQKII